jgi:DNA-directed RNA polymerase specialized sigma24 family protein
VHAYGWKQQEVADLLGVEHATVRTHLARAMAKLRDALEVDHA